VQSQRAQGGVAQNLRGRPNACPPLSLFLRLRDEHLESADRQTSGC
jgi:hypothetical protein